MTDYGQSTYGSGGQASVSDGHISGVSSINMAKIPRAFMRQLPWMIIVLIPMVLASWWFTKDIKRQYHADGKILVRIGSEHVYTPASGTQNSGLSITPDQIVLTEVDIIKNSDIINQVINQMISSPANGGVGGERFAPKFYEKWVRASQDEKFDRWNDIVRVVTKSYAVVPKPKSSIVDVYYQHENGEVAVKVLDAFMTSYENFRKNKFISETSGQIAERRLATEEQLLEVEKSVQRILDKNGISEFATEQLGVQKRAEDLRASLNTLRGQLSAAEAALASTEDQLRATPQTVDLYVDDRTAGRLAQAQLERRQLLAKYLPTSNPVKAKEAEIKQLQAQINANNGKAVGGRRVGPNTVYQSLLTLRNTYQAQADGFREQEIALQNQLNGAVAKVKILRQLDPQYKSLLREKETLEERLKGLNAKEQVALVNQQQQDASSENIKFITRPSIPRKGRNMSKILFAGLCLGAAFSVFMLALLRVYLDPDIYRKSQPRAKLAPAPAPSDYQDTIPEAVPGYGVHQQPPPVAVPIEQVKNDTGQYAHQPVAYDPSAYEPAYEPAPFEQNAYAPPYNEAITPSFGVGVPTQKPVSTSPAQPMATPIPYVPGTDVQPYQAVPGSGSVQNYAGPEGNIPVLGGLDVNPYAK